MPEKPRTRTEPPWRGVLHGAFHCSDAEIAADGVTVFPNPNIHNLRHDTKWRGQRFLRGEPPDVTLGERKNGLREFSMPARRRNLTTPHLPPKPPHFRAICGRLGARLCPAASSAEFADVHIGILSGLNSVAIQKLNPLMPCVMFRVPDALGPSEQACPYLAGPGPDGGVCEEGVFTINTLHCA